MLVDRCGAGSGPSALRISHTVEAATLIPGVASSAWMRRRPRDGFSWTRRMTDVRMERTVGGRAAPFAFRDVRVPLSDRVVVPAEDRVGSASSCSRGKTVRARAAAAQPGCPIRRRDGHRAAQRISTGVGHSEVEDSS